MSPYDKKLCHDAEKGKTRIRIKVEQIQVLPDSNDPIFRVFATGFRHDWSEMRTLTPIIPVTPMYFAAVKDAIEFAKTRTEHYLKQGFCERSDEPDEEF